MPGLPAYNYVRAEVANYWSARDDNIPATQISVVVVTALQYEQ